MAAFFQRRRWTQSDLARAVGLRPEAVRTVLRDIEMSGIPLVSTKDPPQVVWSIRRDWFPGGVLFKSELVPQLVSHLSRLPKSKVRDALLSEVMEQLPAKGALTARAPLVSRRASEAEEDYLGVIEDAAARKQPLAMKYVTASKGGKVSDRRASVHVVDVGPPARFVATCHRSGDLRWFRVDGVLRARIDTNEAFRDCPREEVEAYRSSSLDGYKGGGASIACSFFVRDPECNWVAHNLLEGMHAEAVQGGMRVDIETSAVVRLARFVVGLGEAARPETPVLAYAVAAIARGALEQAERARADIAEDVRYDADRAGTAQPRSGG
ncbi:MAG: helix-turn-helix transcriptional regulator [Polyangiaceae bacterium]